MATHFSSQNRIFGLDVVRSLAIILVLISHSFLLTFPENTSFIAKPILFLGTLGVDIFFVLSGFLIGGIVLKQVVSKRTRFKDFLYFWIRRWFRTLPNYYLILVLNVLLFVFLNGQLVEGTANYFFFLHNFSSEQPDFFTESWSLSIEEFAYILGPLLLIVFAVFTKRLNGLHFLWMTLVVILTITICRLHFHSSNSLIAEDNWSKELRKVVLYRIDSIYYGFLGAYIAHYYADIWRKRKLKLFLIGAILFIATHLYAINYNPEPRVDSFFYNILYLPLLSLSIVFILPVFSSWKEGRCAVYPITVISKLSYAIYLVNYSLVLLTLKHFFNISEFNVIERLGILVLFLFTTYILSFLLYVGFEKPIMDIRDSKYMRRYFLK